MTCPSAAGATLEVDFGGLYFRCRGVLNFGALYFRCRRVLSKAQLAGVQNPDPLVQTGLRIIPLTLTKHVTLTLTLILTLTLTLTLSKPLSLRPICSPLTLTQAVHLSSTTKSATFSVANVMRSPTQYGASDITVDTTSMSLNGDNTVLSIPIPSGFVSDQWYTVVLPVGMVNDGTDSSAALAAQSWCFQIKAGTPHVPTLALTLIHIMICGPAGLLTIPNCDATADCDYR